MLYGSFRDLPSRFVDLSFRQQIHTLFGVYDHIYFLRKTGKNKPSLRVGVRSRLLTLIPSFHIHVRVLSDYLAIFKNKIKQGNILKLLLYGRQLIYPRLDAPKLSL